MVIQSRAKRSRDDALKKQISRQKLQPSCLNQAGWAIRAKRRHRPALLGDQRGKLLVSFQALFRNSRCGMGLRWQLPQLSTRVWASPISPRSVGAPLGCALSTGGTANPLSTVLSPWSKFEAEGSLRSSKIAKRPRLVGPSAKLLCPSVKQGRSAATLPLGQSRQGRCRYEP